MKPLTIFAEGCSTTGEYVIKMKKGAFLSLKKVKPFALKYWYPTGVNPACGALGFLSATLTVVNAIFYTVKCKELPVFEPNEYFWQHHWQEGKEEKWEAYARVI